MQSKISAKWYVYELVDPRNNEVFYVGKGCGDRMYQHGNSSDKTNPKKLNKINSIGFDNVVRTKVALFWDEQSAYTCEAQRICDLIKHQNLTNISIATTLVKKRNQPIFTLKECISYLKQAGWVLAFHPNNYDYVTPDKTYRLPEDFAYFCYENVSSILGYLSKWHRLGKEIPDKIVSRGITLDLGALSD